MKEEVILVDKSNRKIGTEEKLKAHKEGKLHRAFSIFIFNSKEELLLQKRARTKYHSKGLWSNTCCGHPMPKETLGKAAQRRLKEEMGFDCKLKKIFSFIYKKKFRNGLIEHEFDNVFVGKFDGKSKPNPREVVNYKWISIDKLKKDIKKHPEKYTYWLKKALKKYLKKKGIVKIKKELIKDLDFIQVKCPFLSKDNLCAIYKNRPKCCRNYATKTKSCVPEHVRERCSVFNKGYCDKCGYCCKNIRWPKSIPLTKENFLSSHNIECKDCPFYGGK